MSAQSKRQRRHVVAVIGDNNLDPSTMDPDLVAGDEAHKQVLAQNVRTWLLLVPTPRHTQQGCCSHVTAACMLYICVLNSWAGVSWMPGTGC